MLQRINLILLFSVLLSSTIYSQTYNYEDLKGNFTLDLPKGWDLQPQTDPAVFVFQNGAKSIIVHFLEGKSDESELFQMGLNTFKQSGVKDITTSEVKTMSLNNKAARSGFCRGDLDLGNSKVPLYGVLGAAVLENGGLYFLSIMNGNDHPTWKENVMKSFLTVRDVGEEVSEATNVKVISKEELTEEAGKAQVWEHQLLTLSLAAGWKEKEKPASFEKEIIGWFDYTSITGANMMVVAYKGLRMKESAVLDAAKKTVELGIPNATLTNSYTLDLEGKRKATVSVYQGTSVVGGKEIKLTAITSTFKASKCIVNLIGFCGTDSNPMEFEAKIKEVTLSAK